MTDEQAALDGVGDDLKRVQLGFGGKKLMREVPLEIGDDLYLLLKVEISSDGRKETDDGDLYYTAGGRTSILAELSAGDAAQVANQYK